MDAFTVGTRRRRHRRAYRSHPFGLHKACTHCCIVGAEVWANWRELAAAKPHGGSHGKIDNTGPNR